MKIVTWNVNGIRSVIKSGFLDWLKTENPDIVCLQEIKADEASLTEEITQINGYYAYFNSGLKKGHAGVAIYTKAKPFSVEKELGIPRFDDEGRYLKINFTDFSVLNFYIPNGGRQKEDIPYKIDVYKNLSPIFKQLSSQETILVGDFNVAHTELDLFYPKENENNTMFTSIERRQIDIILDSGYVDTFRHKYPEKKAYTWWSYAFNSRDRDIGWRIDYAFVSKPMEKFINEVFTRREVLGSDHGPYGITLTKEFDIGIPPVYPKQPMQSTLFG